MEVRKWHILDAAALLVAVVIVLLLVAGCAVAIEQNGVCPEGVPGQAELSSRSSEHPVPEYPYPQCNSVKRVRVS